MPTKKTGLAISPISEPIIDRVMQEQGYTKLSAAVNFIIQEYDRLSKSDKKEIIEVVEELKTRNINEWFVQEDNNA